jgi:hypothetical protein
MSFVERVMGGQILSAMLALQLAARESQYGRLGPFKDRRRLMSRGCERGM